MHAISSVPMASRIAFIVLILMLCLKKGNTQFCNLAFEFTTQEEIDQFPIEYPDCDSVYSILIKGAGITNLNGLLGLRYVDYSLIIEKTSLISLRGLDSLGSVHTHFQIIQNGELRGLQGLEKMTGFNFFTLRENLKLANLNGLENIVIAYHMDILFNDALVDLQPLHNFQYVWQLTLIDNRGLTSLNGLNNLSQAVDGLKINMHPLLTSLDGLENLWNLGSLELRQNPKLNEINAFRFLRRIQGSLWIDDNNMLSDIDGLNGLTSVDGTITITRNDVLDECDILFFCNRQHTPSKVTINNNATGCRSVDEILISCSDDYSFAKGFVFVDYNCDQTQDANEPPVWNSMILNENYPMTNTDLSGMFMGYLPNNDTLHIHPTNKTSATYMPASYEIITNSTPQLFDSLVFALCADSLYHDLSVHLIPQTLTRRGFPAVYTLCLVNEGLYEESVVVTLSFENHPDVEILESFGGLVTGNTITWEFSAFQVQAQYCFNVEIYINNDVELDSLIRPSVVIAGADTIIETSLDNNLVKFSQEITGSFDPNDKTVSLTEILPSNEETLLAYTIRFQNTGNSYAEFVEILDTLESGLNVRSFQMIDASHSYVLSFPDTNVVKWRFDNIFLPDTTTNEKESHGYVHFLIYAKGGLLPNTAIKNEASIYFDFNDPVQTPPAVTLVKLSTSSHNNNLTTDKLRLYPNPSHGLLYVDLEIQDASSVIMDIISLDGNMLLSKPAGFLFAGQHTFLLNLNTLPKGIYFLRLRTGNGIVSKKFTLIN